MAIPERVYRYTDRPLSWTGAILLGTLIWGLAIVFTGQLPSWIIYKFDQSVSSIIEFTKKIPGVSDQGLNTTQIRIVRDIVANTVQIGAFVAMVAFAYFWQKKKQKRLGLKGPQDPVKGYMSGK